MNIEEIVKESNKLNPEQFSELIYQLGLKAVEDGYELQCAWQDKNAGKYWDIIGDRLISAAENASKYWKTV